MTLRRVPVFAYDWVLVGLVLLINLIGLVTLYSAAPSQGVWLQQMLAFPIALSVGLLVQLFSRRQVLSWAFPLYAVSLVLLVLVLLVGREINGAKAWFNLGPLSFQPLELAKIGLILVLAKVLAARPLERWLDYALPVLLAAPVLGLVLIQPDLGGTLVLIAGLLGMLFVRGMPTIHIVVGLLAVLVLVPTVVWPNLSQYQRDRVEILFDLSKDPKGKGFQQIQSTIAIGSGGPFGKGWLQGTQTHLEFIPERHTDFIFAVFSEERGLVGNSILLILYLLLIVRGLMITANASTLFGRVLAGSITLSFFTYVFVNMGMVSGILPVVGVPLPFMSYGGTALVTLFLGIGILMSIQSHRLLVKQ